MDPLPLSAADWPTFRADAARSGSVKTRLPPDLSLQWRVKLGDRVGAPISVGNQVTPNQPLFGIIDFDSIVARVYVPEKELWRIRPQLEARTATDLMSRLVVLPCYHELPDSELQRLADNFGGKT